MKAFDQAGNSSAFSSAVTASTTGTATGLKYKYYEGAWDVLPDFNTLTPVKTGSTPNIDMSVRNVNDNFGFVWEGSINIKTPGTYTFELVSDDGSKLYFNSTYNPAATATVTNDGLHTPQSATGTVNITEARAYPIAMTFFERDGGETMQVYWTGPCISRQLIPDSVFRSGNGTAGVNAVTGAITGSTYDSDISALATVATGTKAYPNPFIQQFTVEFNNTNSSNHVRIDMYDLAGKLVNSHNYGNLSAGNTTLPFNLNNQQQLKRGMYLVKLHVNGLPVKMWKMVKEL